MTDNDIDWQAEWQAVCSMNIRMANGARPFAEQVHEFEACGDGQPISIRAVSGKSNLTVGDLRAFNAAMIQPYLPESGVAKDALRQAEDVLAYVLTRIEASDEWWMDAPDRGGFDVSRIEAAHGNVSAALATTAAETGAVGTSGASEQNPITARDGGEADKMAHVLLGMVARGTVIDADAVEIGKYITFSESGEHGNAVVSPEISDGVYWTLIGSGPDWDQNRQASEIVRRLNLPMTSESGLRPITMQDVRLAVGEGPLKPADVLAGCNAELARRRALISPAGEVGPDEPILGLSAAPRGVEG